MQWVRTFTPPPRPGDQRTRIKFAWWPTEIWVDGSKKQMVWLERYEVTEKFVRGPMYGYEWWRETGRRLLPPKPFPLDGVWFTRVVFGAMAAATLIRIVQLALK